MRTCCFALARTTPLLPRATTLRAPGACAVPGQRKRARPPDGDRPMPGRAWPTHPISQALGPAACGCNLDPRGIADASEVLRRAVREPAELALANRFGTLEAQGRGMADELLALMLAGIPLLIVVNTRYLAEWRDFTGGQALELPPSAVALQHWWDACRSTAATAG